jgi:hypothetical protein
MQGTNMESFEILNLLENLEEDNNENEYVLDIASP